MAYFLAYGCELNRAHILSRTVVAGTEGATVDAAAAGTTAEGQGRLDANAEMQSTAQESAATASHVLDKPQQQPAPNLAISGLRNYSLSEPLATGYIPDKALVYRCRQDEHAEPFVDVDTAPGEKLWGLLFDLPPETIDAICREFDPECKCQRQTVVVSTLLRTDSRNDDGVSIAVGELVEAQVLQAVSPSDFPANPVKSAIYRLLPIYLDYKAPMYAIRALLGYKLSTVDGIRTHGHDSAERRIEEVYYKAVPCFAVYRTSEGVKVQYSDIGNIANAQRTSMASVNPLRSTIAGLIDGWTRSSCDPDREAAARFNGRVAAALNQLLLEKDTDGAKFTLEGVKADIIAKRTSRGRVQLVTGAFVTAVGLCILFWIAKAMYGANSPTAGLWLAARAGAVGALFSIAMNIRERTVQIDLNGRDNYADAALRVFVGAIGAGALTCLLQSGAFPSASLGASSLTGSNMNWEVLLTIGFAAGFSERLVSAMFDKFGSNADSDAAPRPAEPKTGQPSA